MRIVSIALNRWMWYKWGIMAEGGEGGKLGRFWNVLIPSWLRHGREANLTDVPLGKVIDAAERGIRLEVTSTAPGKITAEVNKVAVAGDDEHKSSE